MWLHPTALKGANVTLTITELISVASFLYFCLWCLFILKIKMEKNNQVFLFLVLSACSDYGLFS